MNVDGDSSDSDEEEDEGEKMEVDGGAVVEEEDDEEEENDEDIGSVRGKQTERIVSPDEVRAHLRRLFANEKDLVTLIYSPHGPLAKASSSRVPRVFSATSPSSSDGRPIASADIFFMDVVSVPPSRFRPAAQMGDQVFENPQNSLLNGILRQSIAVRDLSQRLNKFATDPESPEFLGEDGKPRFTVARMTTQLYEGLIDLQTTVNSMMDSGKNPMIVRQGKLPPAGVKQLLEKKEGLFRKNMMVRPPSSALLSIFRPS